MKAKARLSPALSHNPAGAARSVAITARDRMNRYGTAAAYTPEAALSTPDASTLFTS